MQNTMIWTLWPTRTYIQSSLLRNIALALLGSALLTASAKISIPFYPVPMTMQTFVVLTLGMAYGWRLGGATMVLYLLEGDIGLPVFAGTPIKGLGLAYMMGPTGGYLLGFVVAAMVCGYLAQHRWDRHIITTALAMVLGNVIIYALGLLWLGALLGWDKPLFSWGLYPFLLGGAFKIALATAILPLCWRVIHRRDNPIDGSQ